MTMKVLVVARSQSAKMAIELLGAARALGGPVAAVCLGPGAASAAENLLASGADEVFWWDDPTLQASPGEAGVRALEFAFAAIAPALVLFSADSAGRDWAPRLAWNSGAGLVTECVGWEVGDDGRLLFHRPVYGGKAMATIVSRQPVQMAVVQPGSFPAPPPVSNPHGRVRRLECTVTAKEAWPRVVEHVPEPAGGPALEDAAIVVAGGRGLGSGENFKLLRELARTLGAAIGASRAAVDEGWASASWQIGQTGKSVRPNLYLAIGISGASQHLAGARQAKIIVAINADKEAPIFSAARIGVVGDCRCMLPPLLAALREALGR
jgi:electron transfer flavoprotein alpha subunit